MFTFIINQIAPDLVVLQAVENKVLDFPEDEMKNLMNNLTKNFEQLNQLCHLNSSLPVNISDFALLSLNKIKNEQFSTLLKANTHITNRLTHLATQISI